MHALPALSAQLGLGQGGAVGLDFPLRFSALRIMRCPQEVGFQVASPSSSRVAARTSSIEVMPCKTLRKPATRKLATPSRAA